MTFRFTNLPDSYLEGTRRLLALKNCQLCADGMPVAVCTGDVLRIQIANGAATLTYPDGSFFRALGLLLEHSREESFTLTEQPRFENLGLQVDLSRNGALRVSALKELMDMLVLMGYRQLYLYLEDMYCVPDRDYFGYMRGRYTPEELKELDDYAADYNMELIPSIQTLGHMEQYLRWDESADIRDTARELLADEDATYQFISGAIQSVMSCFRTKKIVLGLDEAHNLGLGKHLQLHGYQPKDAIFCRHLKKVFEITDALGLEGMIYSDMFFRMAAPDAGYYTESTVIPPAVAAKIPENAILIYWHYGEEPGCDEYMLEKHLALNRKIVFYGGTWTWSGHLPHTEYALRATKEALPACSKYGIKDIVQSVWHDDDGCQCNHFYSLLTLQYTAEYAFGHEDDAWLSRRFRYCTGGDMDAFLAMSDYQCKFKFGEVSVNFMELFRGKTLFWQDVLLGQADEYLSTVPMSKYYQSAALKFQGFAGNESAWQVHYSYIETVFRYLSLKCEIAENLEPAYKRGDTAVLTRICGCLLPELLKLTQLCHDQHKKQWMAYCKPFGWEVLDQRYGGTEARIATAMERLRAFLDGEIPCLEELEEKRLPMTVSPWNTFRRIASSSSDF